MPPCIVFGDSSLTSVDIIFGNLIASKKPNEAMDKEKATFVSDMDNTVTIPLPRRSNFGDFK